MAQKIGHALDFLTFFDGMPELRQPAKVLYPLPELLLCCLVGVVCGANGLVEIEEYCDAKLAFLRRFLPFEQGVASHDTFSDVFNALDREADSVRQRLHGLGGSASGGHPRDRRHRRQDAAPLV